MPAAVSSWNLVRVYGTWRGQGGAMLAGSYKITVPQRITNHTDDTIIPAGDFKSGLLAVVGGSPSLDLLVPATDDPDNDQVGWKLQIDVTLTGVGVESYQIDVPVANRPSADGGNGLGVNLRTVALPPGGPVSALGNYRIGEPGGLAMLDSDGDVVDSDGNKVTGTGGGAWAAITGKPSTFPTDIAGLPAGSVLVVAKSGGTWPARPTSRADLVVFWKGADPSPSIVSSGTGGMRDGVDVRLVMP